MDLSKYVLLKERVDLTKELTYCIIETDSETLDYCQHLLQTVFIYTISHKLRLTGNCCAQTRLGLWLLYLFVAVITVDTISTVWANFFLLYKLKQPLYRTPLSFTFILGKLEKQKGRRNGWTSLDITTQITSLERKIAEVWWRL